MVKIFKEKQALELNNTITSTHVEGKRLSKEPLELFTKEMAFC